MLRAVDLRSGATSVRAWETIVDVPTKDGPTALRVLVAAAGGRATTCVTRAADPARCDESVVRWLHAPRADALALLTVTPSSPQRLLACLRSAGCGAKDGVARARDADVQLDVAVDDLGWLARVSRSDDVRTSCTFGGRAVECRRSVQREFDLVVVDLEPDVYAACASTKGKPSPCAMFAP